MKLVSSILNMLIIVLSLPNHASYNAGFRHSVTAEAAAAEADPFGARDVYLRVAVLQVEPYVMVKRGVTRPLTGDPQQYTGYLIELLNQVTARLGVKYRIYQVERGQYGFLQSDGTWDGLIGELVQRRADLIAAPLYITDQRSRVIDFTLPFLKVGASLLLRRDSPKITQISDLLHQHILSYGMQRYSMIWRAFRRSNQTEYKQLWQRMRRFSPAAFTSSNDEGIQRARHGRYVYILPSTLAEYTARRAPCDLMTVGSFLMAEGYGLAVQKGSSLRPQLNRVLIQMERAGILKDLYHKYWIKQSDCNGVTSSSFYHSQNGNNAAQLTLGGMSTLAFVIFICCLCQS